jgi:hypothetical protein
MMQHAVFRSVLAECSFWTAWPTRADTAMAFKSSTTSALAAIGLHINPATMTAVIRSRMMVLLLSDCGEPFQLLRTWIRYLL